MKTVPFCINTGHTNTDEEHNTAHSRRATSLLVSSQHLNSENTRLQSSVLRGSDSEKIRGYRAATLWNFTHNRYSRIYYKCSFYYVSTEIKNWTESRINCMERGADLLMINSTEEQEFMKKIVCSTSVWIDSTLTSGFWSVGQPNGRRIQNCVVSSSVSWADTQCNYTYKWICENNILPVVLP
uniref:C-type lectin domain-containing protein n=1 Tax=Cyprinus carpio TaxID=7962 RepID=A0A8C1WN60_CYPCA